PFDRLHRDSPTTPTNSDDALNTPGPRAWYDSKSLDVFERRRSGRSERPRRGDVAVSPRSRRLRVIQWATGVVGRHAVAAIAAHPALGLGGARVYREERAGRDGGELGGMGGTGVPATSSSDDVLALDPDCVFSAARGEMAPMRAVADICPLLESGKNVVSTAV